MKKPIILFLMVHLFSLLMIGQITKFRKFGIEQGICNNQIYNIIQDKNGFLWLGTGEGLCCYDGFRFTSKGTDTLVLSSVTSLFKDPEKNMWVGYQNGDILVYDGIKFRKILTGEEINNNSVVGFLEQKEGIIAFTQNNGIVVFSSKDEKKIIHQTFNQFYITAFSAIKDQKILLGSFEGLSIIDITDLENATVTKKVKDLEYIKIQAIQFLDDENYLIGTEDAGLYIYNIVNNQVSDFGAIWNLQKENIQDIFLDTAGDIWLSTFGSGIFRLIWDKEKNDFISIKKYDDHNGLGANDIKKTFEDSEGNFWIGTYNMGLACLTDEAFSFYEMEDQKINKNITAVTSYGNTSWYASNNGILQHEKGNTEKYSFYSAGLPNDNITSLHHDGKQLWIGTYHNGLYSMSPSGKINPYVLENNSLSKSINHITGSADSLWVSTKNGVYLLLNNYLLIKNFSTNNGLGHNNINQVYVDDENNAWIATKSAGISYIDPDLQLHSIYAEAIQGIDYINIIIDKQHNIWTSTAGYGIIMFNSDTIIIISDNDGLKSKYCYSLEIDINNNLWIGHRMGISKINTETMTVKSYGINEGITGDCNKNALTTNANKELIFGTTEGIIIFNPYKEQKKLNIPVLNFVNVRISYGEKDLDYDFHEDIILPYNKYRLRIEFIGLSYKSPETIKYQYKLDGYDEWSDLSELRYASYGKINDGKYTFMVKACNEESLCNETPLTLNIRVKKPFWKMWWFIIIVVSAVVMTVVLIIKIRERKQKALQIYLQNKLDERTREVVKQKEEIEIKNRDITDSINYAQRIQASILPSIKTLQTYFNGCFVFYQPRDIVSGDFYWFGVSKNNKFIIVCADSTGHGVPGAFMSMIGTILIKDICSREDVTKPSDILLSLDNELSNTLNQNLEAERSNDGMDIIVCEIDIKTYYTRISSAMRPVIVYQNGQQIYVKGSRSSVGGHIQKEQKVFENEGFQLAKGDLIYMFSDGYPDQFGGPMEKKFKMVRLKNLLKDIHQKSMDEQFNQVKNTFNIWKEGLEQVDDVLFMGIRI